MRETNGQNPLVLFREGKLEKIRDFGKKADSGVNFVSSVT